ncbi:hypothetical protein DPMN_015892 [Dreissena polymorpha]|uniref:Uncharacterized protein n=1 Tax=Dreissena polymorpha TaxID=45954 RepID=A0A9D4NDP7_DREPO|nr:hypothetical protein DPMN_015892 [Dreissena polymorpha]
MLEGGRRRGRQKKSWMDNVKEWTSLTMDELLLAAHHRPDWQMIIVLSSLISPTDTPLKE